LRGTEVGACERRREVHELDPEIFTKRLLNTDEQFAIKVLACQIVELSWNYQGRFWRNIPGST
jgi:hypothetical protein